MNVGQSYGAIEDEFRGKDEKTEQMSPEQVLMIVN